ncbi:hypothetical protein ACI7BZ_13560 [Xanthobacter sp. AM11]|uniref:hypothetical protein n=1 Tax=Xanthobacter sp. AM11 TaxID=3380643 RepID=UPI0039BFF7B8
MRIGTKAMARTALGSLLLAGGALCAAPALADKAAAERCAAKLPPEARAIYQASAPLLVPGADGRAVVTEQTRNLVMSGKLDHMKATGAAEAAASCLILK